MYAACSTATSGGLVLTTATSPRRTVRPGRIIRYRVRVRSAVKKARQRKHSAAGGQGAGPTLNLRVALPARVRYIQSSTFPALMTYNSRGRKSKLQPVQADGGLLTWEDIGPTRRDFKVKVIVDSTVAPGTLLPFSAQVFEVVPVGDSVAPTCPRLAPNVTVAVI